MVFPGHRTFCTVLRHVDPIGDAMLRTQGGVLARLRHWAFREIHCRKVSVADAKRDALLRFGVTGRMFNGVRFDLDQAVNSWRKGLAWRIGNIKDQIEATQERIASLLRQFAKAETKSRRKAKKSAVRLKRRRLDVLRGRLAVAERELAAGRPRVCFGGGADLRRRDLARWRERRATRINIVGATGETCGNQSVHWDGTTLRVLLPAALTDAEWHEGKRYAKPRKASPEDWLVFPNVTFRYGQDELLRAVEDRRAVTWLVFLADDGRWHAHATITDAATDVVTLGVEWGAVGLDLNIGEVAVTVVDRFGNAKRRLHLPFPVAGTPEGKARGMMGEAARAITDLCLELHLPLAREVLDFSKKKAGLREYGPAHARRLSSWAYSRFFALLDARCVREGVEVIPVDPAYTSVIAMMKYAAGLAMSRHHAAALVIGRRAQGRGERLVTHDGTRLDGPGRNRRRTDGRRWAKVSGLPREDAKASVGTAGSGRAMVRKGAAHAAAGPVAAAGGPTPTAPRGVSIPTPCAQVGGAVAPAADGSRQTKSRNA